MNDHLKTIYYVLWLSHPVIQAAIAIVMLRRKQYVAFKFFFAYIITQILSFALVFPFRANYSVYFYLSWFSTTLSVGLGFMVIHEAFLDAFRPFHTLRDLGTVLFKWAGLVMLLVAGVVTLSTNSADVQPWVQAILTTQRCVRIIQVGMVLFLLFIARYMGVTKRQRSFGIALGFGFFAMVELSLVAGWVGDHLMPNAVTLVNMVAYSCALLIWFAYTIAKSPAYQPPPSLHRPQRWEQSLTDLHQNEVIPASSLIPMFEGMVDRALSRTQPVPASAHEDIPTAPFGEVQPSRAAAARASASAQSGAISDATRTKQ